MPTIDEMKMARDGTLAYGKKPAMFCGLLPVVSRIGYDASGTPVAECRSWGQGEIQYGTGAVRWEMTEAGRRLFGLEGQ
ncbi:MAG: hypothetical protein ACODAA_00925 [Gemmatimonadota bacterium]